jgi:hypothetical protein
MKHELQRLVAQWRAQRDGCKLIADDYAAKANEHRAEVHREQFEVYADVVAELEAAFPWLKPAESEEAA